MFSAIEIARFWSNVAVGRDCECWPWKGRSNDKGYGRFADTVAHRVAFSLINGAIAAGDIIRHRCDNPPCCNPAHLLSGSHLDNMRDAIERHRVAAGTKHHNTRISAEDAAYIKRNPDKLSGKALAERFGMSESSISYMRSGKTWRHVDAELAGAARKN